MLRFSEKTLLLLRDAGWSEDRHFSPVDEYMKVLEQEDFYISDAVREFLYKFGGLLVRHPHAKIKEKTDYFHFDVIKAINSGDPGWVSEEYSSRIGKELCVIGEAFRRSMVLCMSPDKRVYAGADESLFFIAESGELAIESLCNGDELKEIADTDKISITSENFQALKVLKSRLLDAFDIEKMILYGSAARAEADRESDSDLLILTKQHKNRFERHRITDAVFEVNLLYGTNFSSLVVDRASWETGPISVLPIREEIHRDGIAI